MVVFFFGQSFIILVNGILKQFIIYIKQEMYIQESKELVIFEVYYI